MKSNLLTKINASSLRTPRKYNRRSLRSFTNYLNKLGRKRLLDLEINSLFLIFSPEDIFVLMDGLLSIRPDYFHSDVKDSLLLKLRDLQRKSLNERMNKNVKRLYIASE